jgi:D-serine deaminase-like pyridoxal phosphate-dependent protein
VRAVTDAGLKSSSVDCGQPSLLCRALDWDSLHHRDRPRTCSGLGTLTDSFVDLRLTDEHCQMMLSPHLGTSGLPVGLDDQLLLVPGHVDPTVNMHEWMVCVQEGRVCDLWGITRGVGH